MVSVRATYDFNIAIIAATVMVFLVFASWYELDLLLCPVF